MFLFFGNAAAHLATVSVSNINHSKEDESAGDQLTNDFCLMFALCQQKKRLQELKETCSLFKTTAASSIQISRPKDLFPQAECCHSNIVYVLISYCTFKVPFLYLGN